MLRPVRVFQYLGALLKGLQSEMATIAVRGTGKPLINHSCR